jgi:hypothetical protein
MKSILQSIEEALASPAQDVDAEFVEQVRRIRDFKKKLDDAGVVLEPEQLPDTMTLIGHLSQPQTQRESA